MRKHLRSLLLVALIAVPWAGRGQMQANGYTFTTGTDATLWADMTGASSGSTTGDDVASGLLPIGFHFTFNGQTFTQWSYNTNGNIRLGSTANTSSGYSTPFSTSNIGTNSPKIVPLGCDGYIVSGTHYVKYKVFASDGDSTLVIEYCNGTYTTSTRNNLYCVQVHLSQNGNSVMMLFSSTAPAAAPAAAYQVGIASSATDAVIFNTTTHAATFLTAGNSTTNPSGTYPNPGRYYKLVQDTTLCLPPTVTINNIGVDHATIRWSGLRWNSDYVTVRIPALGINQNIYAPEDSLALTNLDGNTQYEVLVGSKCAGNDSVEFWAEESFTTTCPAVQAIPYREDFDRYNSGSGNMASCWHIVHRYSTYPYINTNTTYSPSKALYLYNSATAYNFVTTPAFEVPDSGFMVKYVVRASTSNRVVQAGIIDNLTDTSSFIVMRSDTIATVADYHELFFYFDSASYTGDTVYVAFRVKGSSNVAGGLYLDNVEVLPMPPCRRIEHIYHEVVDATSERIYWDDPAASGNYQLAFATTNSFAAATIIDDIIDTTYTITGLVMGRTYYLWLRGICGGDTSEWSPVIMQKPCSDITGTYNVGFDGMTSGSGNMPSCWTKLHSYSTSYPYVSSTTTASYIHGTPQAIYFYATNGNENFIASPRVAMPANQVHVSFYYYTSSSYARLYYGFVTDLTNYDSSFVVVDSIIGSHTPMSEVEFYGDNLSITDTGWFAIRYVMQGGSASAYVDDVTIEPLTSCRKPDAVSVSNISYNSATVNITPHAATDTEFEVRYGTTSNVDAAGNMQTTVQGTTASLSGLAPRTTYYVWVRTLCTAGDTTSWRGPVSFTTERPCAALSIEAEPGFVDVSFHISDSDEGLPIDSYVFAWRYADSTTWHFDTVTNPIYSITGLDTNTTIYYYARALCDTYVGDTTAATASVTTRSDCSWIGESMTPLTAYFAPTYARDYAYSYVQQLYTADELSFLGDTITGISFWSSSTNATGRKFRIYLGHTDQQDMSSVTSFLVEDSLTLVKRTFTFTYAAGWNTVTFDTPFVLNHNRNLVLAVLDSTGSTSSSAIFYVNQTQVVDCRIFVGSSVCPDPANPGGAENSMSARYKSTVKFITEGCHIPTCSTPMLVVDSASQTSISVSWIPVEASATYTIGYRREFTSNWVETTVTGNSHTFTGLVNNSNYDIRIRRTCGVELSSQIVAQTECGPLALPFVETFEERTLGYPYDVYCWNNGSLSTLAQSNVTYPYNLYLTGNASDYLLSLNQGSYVITPTFAEPLNTLELYFTFVAGGNTYLMVGYLTDDNTGIDSMILLDTVWHDDYVQNAGDSYANVSLLLSSLPANASRLVIASPVTMPTSYYAFIGEMIVRRPSGCATVSGIVVDNTTSTSASMHWASSGAGARYFVEYGQRPLVRGNGTMLNTTDTALTISGLIPSLPYEMYVYAVCQNGDTSDISPVVSFNTACGPIITVPFTYTFNEYRTSGSSYSGRLPNCWEYDLTATDTSVANDQPQCYLIASLTGDMGLLFRTPTTVALPQLTAAPIDTLMLTFSEQVPAGRKDPLVIGMVSSQLGSFGNSFEPIDTLAYQDGVTRYDRRVYLVNYNGTSTNIAFSNILGADNTDSISQHLIDNLTIGYAPSCVPVQHVTAESVSDVDAIINWRDMRSPSTWQVEYGHRGFVRGTGTMLTVTSHPMQLQGLTPHTEYDLYVRAICTAGDSAEWSAVCSFQTGLCANPIETTITDSTSGTGNSYLPFNAFFKHSVTQQIYRPNEIGSAMSIASIMLNCNTPINGFYGNIYMGHTTVDSLTAWVPDSTLQLVYTGYFNATAAGWTEFALDSAFRYNGGSNLLVMIKADSTEYATNGNRFKVHSARLGSSYYYSNDDTPWTPASSGTRTAYRNDIRFVSCGGTCAAPAITGIDSTETTLTVHFTSDVDSVELKICIGEFDESVPSVFATGSSYTFTGLGHSTAYVIGVRTVCSDELVSAWTLANAATVVVNCGVPAGLAVQGTTYTSVSVSWTAAGDEQAWEIEVDNTTMTAETYTANTTSYTIDNLMSGRSYTVRVRALCGSSADIPGEWSDAITVAPDVCQPITDVTVSVRGTSATLTWSPATNGTGRYHVEYGYNGFSHGEEIGGSDVSDTTYTITGLDPNTTYDAYVGNICTDDLMRWSDPVATFTTGSTGIATVDAEGNLSIYPNPASEMVTISVSNMLAGGDVAIISIDGREAASFKLDGNKASFDVSQLAKGAYFVRIAGEQAATVRKLIVK